MTAKALSAIEVVELSSGQVQQQTPQQDALVNGSSSEVEGKDTSHISTTDEESEANAADRVDGTTSSAAIWLITVALALSFFLTGLDANVLATAIPTITDHFHSVDDIGWYSAAYLFTSSTSQLCYGKIYQVLPEKTVYLVAIGIFEFGSLLCGVAPTSSTLIVGRAIAGIGSAGIMSGVMSIMRLTIPLRQRPKSGAVMGAIETIAIIIGPLLGGILTDRLSWRWIFFINLPIGAVVFAVIVFLVRIPLRSGNQETRTTTTLRDFDIVGVIFMMAAVISFFLTLQWAGIKYPWANARIISLLVVSGVLSVLFVLIQLRRKEKALLPPRILRQRSTALGAWYGLSAGAALSTLQNYLPIWFQVVKGASATKSGIMLLPTIIAMLLAVGSAGFGTSKIGYYVPFMIIGSTLISISVGLFTTLQPNTGHAEWIGYQVIFGLGIGSGFQQPLVAAQTLDAKDVSTATAVVLFAQTFGGALAVAVAQNVFLSQLTKRLPNVDPGSDAKTILLTGLTAFRNSIPSNMLKAVVASLNSAITTTFVIALVFGCLTAPAALGMEWRSVKSEGQKKEGSEKTATGPSEESMEVV